MLVRIDRLIYRAKFAAAHESAVGTSRRFVAMQQYVGYRGHSGPWQAVCRHIFQSTTWSRFGGFSFRKRSPDERSDIRRRVRETTRSLRSCELQFCLHTSPTPPLRIASRLAQARSHVAAATNQPVEQITQSLSRPPTKNIPLNASGKSAALLRASHGR